VKKSAYPAIRARGFLLLAVSVFQKKAKLSSLHNRYRIFRFHGANQHGLYLSELHENDFGAGSVCWPIDEMSALPADVSVAVASRFGARVGSAVESGLGTTGGGSL
jgi:hypothetical protein